MAPLDVPPGGPANPQGRPRSWLRSLLWALPLLELFASGFLLWQSRADIAYLISSAAPLDLGAPGSYRLDRARSGIFARIAGQPGPQAVRYRRGLRERELVPLVEAPLILDRAPTRSLTRATPAGAPDATPVVALGELERDDEAPQLREVVTAFIVRDELPAPDPRFGTPHVWILNEGVRPRQLDGTAVWILLLLALFVFNLGWLGRRLTLDRGARPWETPRP